MARNADSARQRLRPARTADTRPCGVADAVGADLAAYTVGSPAVVRQAHVTRGVVTRW